ncbi:hypothetical protein PIB30_096411 [Stylosanthes scabra]|uniref:Uncharacterized protein n=1 Tax=Stylosanthes scabra TaxID=79078 RepID=A0ABU6WUE3_9FABA|nr:hypothetical protein [Stylosanthes scabra]
MCLLVHFRLLGIEKSIEKAKEDIRSKGFTKESQEVESWALRGQMVPLCVRMCSGKRFGTKKNEERKLEEQKGRKLEHSARAPMPRRPEQQPWSSSSTPKRGHQRLGISSPPQGQVTHA